MEPQPALLDTLNDRETCFDRTVEHKQVFKETIVASNNASNPSSNPSETTGAFGREVMPQSASYDLLSGALAVN